MSLRNPSIMSMICLSAVFLLVTPTGYLENLVQAQLLPSPTPPPSAPPKTPAPSKATPAPSKSPANALKIDVILYGVDNKTGNVVTFVVAKNHTDSRAFNATDANIKHENSTGVAEAFFTLPNVTLKVADKFQACAVLVKDLHLVCGTGLKSPLNRTESVNLLTTGPSTTSSNKTTP